MYHFVINLVFVALWLVWDSKAESLAFDPSLVMETVSIYKVLYT